MRKIVFVSVGDERDDMVTTEDNDNFDDSRKQMNNVL